MKYGNASVECSRCHENGHIAVNCWRCFRCQRIGHIARYCPGNLSVQTGSTAPIVLREADRVSGETPSPVQMGGRKVNGLTSVDMENSMVVDGFVGSRPCKILLDSGASLCVVRKSLINDGRNFERPDFSFLRVANGSSMRIMGKIKETIRVGGTKAVIELHIAEEMSQECIIGVDGLKALGVILNFAGGKID